MGVSILYKGRKQLQNSVPTTNQAWIGVSEGIIFLALVREIIRLTNSMFIQPWFGADFKDFSLSFTFFPLFHHSSAMLTTTICVTTLKAMRESIQLKNNFFGVTALLLFFKPRVVLWPIPWFYSYFKVRLLLTFYTGTKFGWMQSNSTLKSI